MYYVIVHDDTDVGEKFADRTPLPYSYMYTLTIDHLKENYYLLMTDAHEDDPYFDINNVDDPVYIRGAWIVSDENYQKFQQLSKDAQGMDTKEDYQFALNLILDALCKGKLK